MKKTIAENFIPLPGTQHEERAGDFIFLTKRVRIPKRDILDVRPPRDGRGAYIVTEKGALRVCEDYAAIMQELFPVPAPQVGANVGDELDRAGVTAQTGGVS